MEPLIKALVGSRLYGIHNESSDYDYRGIVITPLREFLYQEAGSRHIKTEQNDVTLYEFSHFMRLAEKGNATIIETIVGEKSGRQPDAFDGVDWRRVVDPNKAIGSWKGYANAQLKKYTNEPPLRAGKSIASGLATYNLTMLAVGGCFDLAVVQRSTPKELLLRLRSGEGVEEGAKLLKGLADVEFMLGPSKYDPEYVKDVIYYTYTMP